jgi:hypothetical protein
MFFDHITEPEYNSGPEIASVIKLWMFISFKLGEIKQHFKLAQFETAFKNRNLKKKLKYYNMGFVLDSCAMLDLC